jgi:predicted methyltransferase
VVKSEITAAGFIFEGESRVLRDQGDSRKANVFDPSIRGRTDQFVYKFRKPSTAR